MNLPDELFCYGIGKYLTMKNVANLSATSKQVKSKTDLVKDEREKNKDLFCKYLLSMFEEVDDADEGLFRIECEGEIKSIISYNRFHNVFRIEYEDFHFRRDGKELVDEGAIREFADRFFSKMENYGKRYKRTKIIVKNGKFQEYVSVNDLECLF